MRSKNGVLLIQKRGEEQGKFDRRWSVAAVIDAGDRHYISVFSSGMPRIPSSVDLRDRNIGCNLLVAIFPLYGHFGSFFAE